MSSVSIMRTKAEEAIIGAFANVVDRLPGAAGTADARSAAIAAFKELGLPHRRIEEWKYTDLRTALPDMAPPKVPADAQVAAVDKDGLEAAIGPLAGVDAQRVVLVDGSYREDLSDKDYDNGLNVRSLGRVLNDDTESGLLDLSDDSGSVVALNAAFATDGAMIDIAEGAVIKRPVFVIMLRASGDDALISARHFVRIGHRAEATIVEISASCAAAGAGQTNVLRQVAVGEGAQLSHVHVSIERDVTQLTTSQVDIGREANYRGFQFTSDVALARHQVFARYSGADAKLDLSGAFLGRGKQHIDNTLVVEHEVPGCESRELFKGVLDDEARGVFQGKVVVQPEAQKTDGKQMAQALLLSENCEFDSKPELEIYADDVVCGHGSTCAEIDPDLVFYCRSRGIPEATARALLIESFIGEAIQQVDHESVADALSQMARHWLETKQD